MIEEKLIEKGISKEELDSFSKRPLHNAKQSFLLTIINSKDIVSLKYKLGEKDSYGGTRDFYMELFNCLKEIGTKDFNYKPGFAAQAMALEMYRTLSIPKKYGQHDFVSLNILYQDTIKRLENKNV